MMGWLVFLGLAAPVALFVYVLCDAMNEMDLYEKEYRAYLKERRRLNGLPPDD